MFHRYPIDGNDSEKEDYFNTVYDFWRIRLLYSSTMKCFTDRVLTIPFSLIDLLYLSIIIATHLIESKEICLTEIK